MDYLPTSKTPVIGNWLWRTATRFEDGSLKRGWIVWLNGRRPRTRWGWSLLRALLLALWLKVWERHDGED